MEPLVPDATNACRICFDAKSENRFKFEVNSEWTQLFQYCVGLIVQEGCGPLMFCYRCADKLKEYASFKSQCLQADMGWKQLMNTVKTEKSSILDKVKLEPEDFDRLDDSLSSSFVADYVKPDPYDLLELSIGHPILKSNDKETTSTSVVASPLQIKKLKRKKDKSSKSDKPAECKPGPRKYPKLDKDLDSYNTGIKVKRQCGRSVDISGRSVIPVKIHPFTDEEMLERRAMVKNNDIKKYMESIGKADKEYMREEEFLQKYYKVVGTEHCKRAKSSKIKTIYGCRKCDKKLKSKKTLVSHTKDCEGTQDLNVILDRDLKVLLRGPPLPESKVTYCGVCEFSSNKVEDVNEHWKEHVACNMTKCKLCTYTGKDLADMVVHRYKHHPSDVRHWIRCPVCSECWMQMNRLEYHYRSVHLNKKGGVCSYCDKEFVDYKSWTSHQIKHTVDRFVCDHCGRNFMYRHDIEYHLEQVFGNKKYTCETCGKVFKRMSNLRLHINCRHTEVKPIKCDHCGRMFKNEKTLSRHLKQKDDPKCFCEICGKGFRRPANMKTHMIQHTGERPFKCEYCGSGFNSKSYLKVHVRGHTGQKPYACQTCSKAFATSMQLKSHQSVHTGIRRVKCTYCDRTFYNKQGLVSHCNLKHQIIITKDEPK